MIHKHHRHNHYGYQRNPLDISELADFDEAISQFSQTEQRRRRLIYLRDAAEKLKTGKAMLKGFGWLMIPLALFPPFWPFFIFAWLMRKKAGSMMHSQLQNALEYWGIHEVEIDAYVSGHDSMDSDPMIPGL